MVLQGDVVTKVEAIDGDRGRPRRIKYGLVSENRPFTVLFEIGLFSGWQPFVSCRLLKSVLVLMICILFCHRRGKVEEVHVRGN